MKCKTIFLLIFVFAVSVMFMSCEKKEPKPIELEKKENYLYEENADGTITITGWVGLENEITIPSEINGKNVTVIGENAFRAMRGLTYVKIPNTVKVIDYAFSQCTALTTVELGQGIEKMNGAFMGCTALTTVTGGDNVMEMSEAFENCTSITSAIISDTVSSCVSAFKGCTALTDVTVESGVTSLNYTFEGCLSLKTVSIPSTVTEAVGTFEGCTMLENVIGGENIEIYEATFKGCSSIKEITLSSSVKVIKEAFVNCSALEKINGMPDAVEKYLPSFTGCSALKEIVIPESTNYEDAPKYDLLSDIDGCELVEKLEIFAQFSKKTDFCKTFSGLSYLEELIIPDDNFEAMMKVESFYMDMPYKGNDKAVASALDYAINTTYVRITDNYGNIDGVNYVHVQGTDIEIFDAEQIERETEILGFKDFTKATYWCGYPEGSDRKNTAIAIERLYTFYLRTTGKNDGSLPPIITVNGVRCSTETMEN